MYFKQSEVFKLTLSIELWSELDVDMDTLCGGTENTHTLPQGVAGRMVVLDTVKAENWIGLKLYDFRLLIFF